MDDQPGREAEKFGPYRIEGLLGRGGMGEVHRAYDTVHERFVALKRLSAATADEDYRARFRRESRIVARLNEPHVIPIHAFGEIDGRLYLDMRLVEGQDLKGILAAGPLPPARAIALLTQVAQALDAAHADGLVHRDVKPSNVLVADRDFAYLADFGIAQSASPEATSMTGTGGFIGSLDYIAPERLTSGPVDGRADVYSLACMLFECLTGRLPFAGLEPAAMLTAHLAANPPAASRLAPVPAALDAVIARGMSKDPGQRYPSAGELMSAAAGVMAADATVAAPPMAPPPPAPGWAAPPERPARRSGGRWPWFAAAAAVVTAAAVVAVLLLIPQNSESPVAGGSPGGAGIPGTSTTTTTTTTTTSTTTNPPPSPPIVDRDAQQLLEDLPAAYRGNSSCEADTTRDETWATGKIVALVRCTTSNVTDYVSGNRPLYQPAEAQFFRFSTRSAAEKHFMKIANANDLVRDDQRVSCISPGHEGKLYGKGSPNGPDNWLTCFRTSVDGWVMWANLEERVVGKLRTDSKSLADMEGLYLWWNQQILGQG